MAMDYNLDTNTTRSTAPPPAPERKSMTWLYAIVGVLVLAVVAMFAMSGNQAGDSTTTGTPSATVDTGPSPAAPDSVPPATAPEPMPAAPATPTP